MDRPIIILGGGLWGSLLAYRLNQQIPEQKFILYEKEMNLGGNHTWSFFGSDIEEQTYQWIKPFIKKSWEQYKVAFPQYQRSIMNSYHSLTSELLHKVVKSTVTSERLCLGQELSLHEARKLGSFVIDARGISSKVQCGYQKFLGLKVRTRNPHGLNFPLIMDATVEQLEGFRFFYYLPWSEGTLLVEDTRYSIMPDIHVDKFRLAIIKEIEKRGWEIAEILEEERGSLPIPLRPLAADDNEGIISLAGIFNDTTGYSLPLAVKLINELMTLEKLDEQSVRETVNKFRVEFSGQRTFYRLLNQLLFKAAAPDKSYRMLEFFYRHDDVLIKRFYAGELSHWDKVRFFMGRPPVSVSDAIGSFLKKELV
jgi:lycopene beta-cyclase